MERHQPAKSNHNKECAGKQQQEKQRSKVGKRKGKVERIQEIKRNHANKQQNKRHNTLGLTIKYPKERCLDFQKAAISSNLRGGKVNVIDDIIRRYDRQD